MLQRGGMREEKRCHRRTLGRIAAAGKTGKLSCDIAEYQSANVSVSEEKAGHDLLFGERNDGNEKTPLLGAGISAMALGVAAILPGSTGTAPAAVAADAEAVRIAVLAGHG